MRRRYPYVGTGKLCGLFGKTRQAWYRARQHREQEQMCGRMILHRVRQLRIDLPRCGVRKLHHLLQPFLLVHGIKLGRDGLFDLLRDHNLLIKRRKSRKTTFSFHHFRKHPNLITELEVNRPNQLWVSDITYLDLGSTFCYLTLITDAFSRKIIGWHLSQDLSVQGPLCALNMAIAQWKTHPLHGHHPPPIHHSDRGIQYCCHQYTSRLEEEGIMISMTQHSDPYENALAERMNRTLKEEFLAYRQYFTYEEAVAVVQWAVQGYNTRRPHLSLNFQTPAMVHAAAPQRHLQLAKPARGGLRGFTT